MVALATYALPEVVERVKLDAKAKGLLDVGGGHGLYSIGYCERYPALHATIFDSPCALISAQENIAKKQLGDRSATQPRGNHCGWAQAIGRRDNPARLFMFTRSIACYTPEILWLKAQNVRHNIFGC